MVSDRLFLLVVVTVIFFSCGGIVDYWQAAMEHKKYLPQWLEDFFLVIWLFIYTGIFPFLLVFIASDFNSVTAGIYLGAIAIGSVCWDICYSLLDTGKLTSKQKGYFVMKRKNYGLSQNQIVYWHILRLMVGLGCIWYFAYVFNK